MGPPAALPHPVQAHRRPVRADLVHPGPDPFVDELVLGFGTLLLANWKSRNAATPPPLEQR
jgi:hypothetical protein